MKTTLINLHGRRVHKGDSEIRSDGEVWIRGKWIYIGRAQPWLGIPQSRWHNVPFKEGTYEEIVAKYETLLLASPGLLRHLPNLKGQILACWCVPHHACHGTVLARLANDL